MNATFAGSRVWKQRCDVIATRLRELGLLPVAEIPDESVAGPLTDALVAADLPCLEVTLRTPAAAGGLRAAREAHPQLLLGAGTVLSPDDVDVAVACGADFIVSPGLSPTVVSAAHESGMPIIPGICTPTDLQAAIEMGVDTVKFFPAVASGGVPTLVALSAPFPMIRFVPTGGISTENLTAYLQLDQVIACGGSWLVAPDLLDRRDFGQVEACARDAVRRVRDAR